jgi:hypothetical protein
MLRASVGSIVCLVVACHSPGDAAPTVTVLLSAEPPIVAEQVWLWTRDASRTTTPVSARYTYFDELSTTASSGTDEAVVFVPTDASWSGRLPAGAGNYALLAAWGATPGRYRVVRWLATDSPPANQARTPDDALERFTVRGQVTDQASRPIADVLVHVGQEAATETDAAGAFELELQGGEAVVVAMRGESTVSRRIVVGADTPSVSLQLTSQGSAVAQQFEGRVIDANLGTGVASAAISRGRFRVPPAAVSDATGTFTLPASGALVSLSVRQTGYAWHSVLSVPSARRADIALQPLPPELIGTWTYCHSRMSSGRLYRPVPTNPQVQRVTTLRLQADGLSENLPLVGVRSPWKAVPRGGSKGQYVILQSGLTWAGWVWDLRSGSFSVENGLLVNFTSQAFSPDPDQNHEADVYARSGCPALPGDSAGSGTDAGAGMGGADGGRPDCTRLTCVVVTSQNRGTFCGNPASLNVRYRNDCGFPVAVRYCLRRTAGTWDCGVESNLAGGVEGGLGAWTCNSTGAWDLYAVRNTDWTNGTCRVPQPP